MGYLNSYAYFLPLMSSSMSVHKIVSQQAHVISSFCFFCSQILKNSRLCYVSLIGKFQLSLFARLFD